MLLWLSYISFNRTESCVIPFIICALLYGFMIRLIQINHSWLVVYLPLWKMMEFVIEFVSWDDDIPFPTEWKHHPFMFQSPPTSISPVTGFITPTNITFFFASPRHGSAGPKHPRFLAKATVVFRCGCKKSPMGFGGYTSGYVKIAIENGHRNSGFTH